ncbi:hypothetical protein ScPMuIL_016519 [Solemya velum]
MIRISALNESSSENVSLEAKAFMLYNVALGYQKQGDISKAVETFEELLQHDFVKDAARHIDSDTEGIVHPGLRLLYSTHKNMAAIAANQQEYNRAMEFYLEAIKIDTSEVTVWYKIGTIALKIHNFSLARLGFEQGLHCNSKHWPCLDNIITILYALNNYWSCLYYISKALEQDDHYMKGHAFRNQIFSEQPSLRQDTTELWSICNPDILTFRLDREEAAEYVNEALEMRKIKQELAKLPEPKPITLPKPITAYTWKSVGESLIALYDKVSHSDSSVNLASLVEFISSVSNKETVTPQDVEMKEQELEQLQEVQDTEVRSTPIANTPDVPVSDVPSVPVTETPTQSQPQSPLQPESVDVSLLEQQLTQPSDHGTPPNQPFTPVSQVDVLAIDTPPVTLVSPPTPQLSMLLGSQQDSPVCQIPATVALQDHPNPLMMELDETSIRRGATGKRKRLNLADDLGGKRRSARVRNTSKKKEEEYINFQELLQTFLPSSLNQVEGQEELESQSGHMAVEQQITPPETMDTDVGQVSEILPLSTTEEEDVKKFIESQTARNNGTIDIIKKFLFALADRTNMKWPECVRDIYLQLYARVRKNLIMPNYFGCMVLIWAELQLDLWMVSKSKHSLSPGASPRSHSPASQPLLSEALPEYCMEDLWYITGLTPWDYVLQDFWCEYCVRVYWMRSRFFMIQNQVDEALLCFNKTIEYLTLSKEENNASHYQVINCKSDSVISIDEVKNHQESLQRCQSLDETQRLYDAGDYRKVAEILLQTFKSQPRKVRGPASDIPERQAQLILLQDSLFRTEDFQKCLLWGEISLNEALQHYKKASSNDGRAEWADTLVQIFTALNRVLDKDLTTIRSLPSKNLVRLAQNLIWVIESIMSAAEYASDLPITTLLPFVLLYKLIKHEEEKIQALQLKTQGKPLTSLSEGIPSSLMLLNIAHECLGRHSWCTKCEGTLLLFFLDVLKPEMMKHSQFKQELDIAFEQCVYCLYGYPNKKGKSRRLQDHIAPQITLTWKNSIDLFEYFKPKSVPEFDSYKADTINAEFEAFLKRITSLIPDNCQPGKHENTLAIQEYIEGNTNTLPSPQENLEEIPSVVREIYYLLADYYFKNKEQAKAIKFYIYDLSVNQTRLDAWAGMALARMSQLEHKLDSMELKMDVSYHKKSISALRCFRKAVSLDEYMSKLWIEYGSLAFQLHSHSSRQLKLKNWFHMANDLEEIVSESRQEMLQIAFNCYKKASECEGDGQEEEWLHHYMMGKCLEKMRKPPIEYLTHYKQAAIHLYEDNATYPKKITYAFVAPRLAVESLEVFYRLHVAMLKQLLKKKADVDFGVFESFINEAAESPFARGREKRREKREGRESASSATEDTMSPVPTKKCKLHTTSSDHNYSKMKNSTDSSDNSMDLGKDSVAPFAQNLFVTDSSQASGSLPTPSTNSRLSVPSSNYDLIKGETTDEVTNKRRINDNDKVFEHISDSSLMKDLVVSDSSTSQSVPNKELVATSAEQGSTKDQAEKTQQMVQQKLKLSPFSMASILGENTHDSKRDNEMRCKLDLSEEAEIQKKENVEVKECADDSHGEPVSPEQVADISVFSGMDENSAIDDELEKLCRSVAEGEEDGQFPEDSGMPVDEPSSSSTPKKYSASPMEEESCGEVFYPSKNETRHDIPKENSPAGIEAVHGNKESDMDPDVTQRREKPGEIEIADGSVYSQVGNAKKEDHSNNYSVLEISDDISKTESPAHSQDLDKTEPLVFEISSEHSGVSEPLGDTNTNNQSLSDTALEKPDRNEENQNDNHQTSEEYARKVLSPGQAEGSAKADVTQQEVFTVKSLGIIPDKNEKEMTDLEFSSVKNEEAVIGETRELSNTESTKPRKLKYQESQGFDIGVKTEPETGSASILKDSLDSTEKSIKKENVESSMALMAMGSNEIEGKKAIVLSDNESQKKVGNGEIEKEMTSEETAHNEETNSSVDKNTDHVSEGKETKLPQGNPDKKEEHSSETTTPSVIPLTKPEGMGNDSKSKSEIQVEHHNEEQAMDLSKPADGEKTGEQQTVEDQDGPADKLTQDKNGPVTETEKRSTDSLHKELIEKCIKALTMCLQRFPTHYKSLYRLANVYYRSPYHKNLEYAKDLLLGSPNWQKLEHMPIQGLFGERKQNNFFQGIWKLPIQEIDRSGSFASHVNRSVMLLLNVLKELKDTMVLLSLHTQLMRTPDTGRKYLRDAERVYMAKLALRYTLDTVIARTKEMKSVDDEEKLTTFLLDVHKIWSHATSKLSPPIERANKLFAEAFIVARRDKVKPGIPPLEQAIKFCQFLNITKSAAQAPTPSSSIPTSSSPDKPTIQITTTLTQAASPSVVQHDRNIFSVPGLSPLHMDIMSQQPVIRLKPLSPVDLKWTLSREDQRKLMPKMAVPKSKDSMKSQTKDNDNGALETPVTVNKSQSSSFQDYFEKALLSQGAIPKKPQSPAASSPFQESFEKAILGRKLLNDSQDHLASSSDNQVSIKQETSEKVIPVPKFSAADSKVAESSATSFQKTTTLFNVTSNLNKVKQGTMAEVSSPSAKSESEEQEVISIDDTSSDSSVASPEPPPQLEDTRQTREIFPPVHNASDSRSSSSSYRPSSDMSSRSSSPALAEDAGTVAEDVSWMVRSEESKIVAPISKQVKSVKNATVEFGVASMWTDCAAWGSADGAFSTTSHRVTINFKNLPSPSAGSNSTV